MTSFYTRCQTCQSKFSSRYLPKCTTCGKASCPECSKCECIALTITKRTFKSIKINKIDTKSINTNLEITGTLSPLISQKPVKMLSGMMIISEFEFSDETGKLPIIFWGPVPAEIFSYRYEFIQQITITGVNARFFNNQLHLYVPKSAGIHINQSKHKPLLQYLMLSS